MNGAEQTEKTRLFDNLEEHESRLFLKHFETETFSPKQYIFKEGEPGRKLYIVQRGLVSVTKRITANIEKKLFSARIGTIFGEFSFMDKGERSASAMAEEETLLLSLNQIERGTVQLGRHGDEEHHERHHAGGEQVPVGETVLRHHDARGGKRASRHQHRRQAEPESRFVGDHLR